MHKKPEHPEHHRLHRSGWLRAAVLGANDGIVSISSLMLGVGAISLCCLAGLGAIAAKAGGARLVPGAARVLAWGIVAMAVTTGVGALFGIAG